MTRRRILDASLVPGVVASLLLCSGVLTVRAADRFVSPKGVDAGNTCLASQQPCRSLRRGLAQVESGDTLQVARGLYREALRIDSSLTLDIVGGWNQDFSVRDPAIGPTILDGGNAVGMLEIEAGAGEVVNLTLSTSSSAGHEHATLLSGPERSRTVSFPWS